MLQTNFLNQFVKYNSNRFWLTIQSLEVTHLHESTDSLIKLGQDCQVSSEAIGSVILKSLLTKRTVGISMGLLIEKGIQFKWTR